MYVVTPQISGGNSETSVKVATGTFKLPMGENNQPIYRATVDVGFRPRAVFGSYGDYRAFAFEEKRSGGGVDVAYSETTPRTVSKTGISFTDTGFVVVPPSGSPYIWNAMYNYIAYGS